MENIKRIISICPDIQEDLLSSVDQPLQLSTCSVTGKGFLQCDFNRDGGSYRSPWSGQYEPASDGYKPSDQLRQLEVQCNEAFKVYSDLYYGNGTSSVYLWDLEQGFAAAILIKKGLIN
jgi:capping protein beta